MKRAGTMLRRIAAWRLLIAAWVPAAASADTYPVHWFYLPANLLVDATTAKAIRLVREAAAAGLNGVVLADSKLGTLEQYGYDRPGGGYRRNIERFLAECRRHDMEVIPHVPEVARGESILSYNVNLAAGHEVRDANFEVQKGVARLVPDPGARLAGGDFEESDGKRLAGWKFQDAPGVATSQDTTVRRSGKASARFEPAKGPNQMCRMNQKVALTPHRQYRVTLWVKTQDLDKPGAFRVSIRGVTDEAPRNLTYGSCDVRRTQDWTRYDLSFNSRIYDTAVVHWGLWGAGQGTLWIDDAELVEIGLVNVLRRDGCPLRMTKSDGHALLEGVDFEHVLDPLLGMAKGWPGTYDSYHREPVIKVSEFIPDGTRLSVSYFHALITGGTSADCCLTEPEVEVIFERQLRRISALLDSPRHLLLGLDELRTAAGCARCQASGKTPGQLLADHVRRFTAIARKVQPGVEVIVWHDMFDPAANAGRTNNLIDGSLEGSWEGLDPSVIVCAWSHATREKTLPFFAERGHRIIASTNVQDTSDPGRLLNEWKETMDRTPGVLGALHTCWDLDRHYFAEFNARLSTRDSGPVEVEE